MSKKVVSNRSSSSNVQLADGSTRRLRAWFAARDWWSWDLLVGGLTSVAVGCGSLLFPAIRGSAAPTFLYALAAAFVAMLGIVMAVMAVLIGLMSPSYRAILDAIPGGIRRAMNPYFIVVFGCAVGALAALLGALGWPAMAWWSKAATLSLASGMAGWLLAGSAQLLIVTFNHGSDSASLDRHQASVRAARDDRLRQLGR